MKIFECKDTDHGRLYYIVAHDIKQAIDRYMKECNNIPPEIVRNITPDGEPVLIQN